MQQSYRIAELNKLYSSAELTIDLAKAKKSESDLVATRERYEQLLRETFLANYLDNYRFAIFGSSRVEPDSATFNFVKNLACKVGSDMDIDIVTGGGGGLMYAANLGLKKAQGRRKNPRAKNLGILVNLEHEEGRNDCLDVTRQFENFSTRLESFIHSSNAIYLAPGGLGTDLEAAMFMQLKQLQKLEPTFPILAHPFWKPIFNYENGIMYQKQLKMGRTTLIGKDDMVLVHFTDNLKEIGHILKASYDGWLMLREKVKFIN